MPSKKDYLSARELSTKVIIANTRTVLLDKDSWSYKFKGLKEPRYDSGALDIRVSPKLLSKALDFMHAFIDYGLERGHDVIVKYGLTRVVILGQEEKVSFRERTKVVKKDPSERYGFRQYEPTGLLTFKSEWHFEWREGTKTLEQQIPIMYEKLEGRVNDLLTGWERMRIEEEQEALEEARLQEIENRKKKELADFKILLDQSLRWQRTKNLREYLDDIAKIKGEIDPSWLAWAKAKVNWYDPFVEARDEMLVNVNRDSLEFTEENTDDVDEDD